MGLRCQHDWISAGRVSSSSAVAMLPLDRRSQEESRRWMGAARSAVDGCSPFRHVGSAVRTFSEACAVNPHRSAQRTLRALTGFEQTDELRPEGARSLPAASAAGGRAVIEAFARRASEAIVRPPGGNLQLDCSPGTEVPGKNRPPYGRRNNARKNNAPEGNRSV